MFCKNKKIDEPKRLSDELSRFLEQDAHRKQGIIEILLLGTGESGKTTIIKQMKIIHINGFSKEERCERIPHIRQNLHESIYDILNNMNKISPQEVLRNESSHPSAEYILGLGPREPEEYSQEYFDHIKVAWADPGVKKTLNRSNEFQLIDSAEYFLNRIDNIQDPNYVPTEQDILYCRIKTVSISKIEFSKSIPKIYGGGKAQFWMYDVGGQRGERKKWIQVFDGIKVILFLIAASDFDQTLREDNMRNRLEEAFQVFDDIFWSRFVKTAAKIVFLNKQDILKKKIENGHRIETYFPEYADYQLSKQDIKEGNSSSEYDRTKCFIRQQILNIAERRGKSETATLMPGLVIQEDAKATPPYIHFTTATDTNNIQRVFDSVHDFILVTNMKAIFVM